MIKVKPAKEILLIGTSDTNPRNGEGSFIKLLNGNIMFGYTEFSGNDSCDDDAHAQIVAITSKDGGNTWGDKRVLFTKPEGSQNIMSLSFLRMHNGDLGAFYILKHADGADSIILTRSTDEGLTWSNTVDCTACMPYDYYILNNDRVKLLPSGRILLPLARHTIHTPHGGFVPGEICFAYSDDDGFTWEKSPAVLQCPFETVDGYEEPGVHLLPDGRLWCYIRTNMGYQFECFSNDEGITWTVPKPNLFFSSPCSPMHVKPFNDLTFAVFNPESEHVLRGKENTDLWGRTPYTVAVSTDGGLTFNEDNIFYLEDDRENGYCYPALLDCGDHCLIAYYHSNNSGICLNSTKIVRVDYDDIKTLLN